MSRLNFLALALVTIITTGCGNDRKEANDAGPAVTPSAESTSISTVTATHTATATATKTTTATETATTTVTNVQTSTVTNTVTVSSVATVTQTVTSTHTETETQVATDTRIIDAGKYSSKSCFHNALASEGLGQTIYTRSTLRFGVHGRGSNSFELYEDAECTRTVMQAKLKIRYTVTEYFDRLYLIAVEQYNDPKDKKSVARYWIPALKTKEGLLLDIDAAQGAKGPFLTEPSEEELKSILEDLERRAVVFAKIGKKS